MVAIWNRLARGNEDYCAILIVVNSLLQVVLYSPYSLLFVNTIGGSGDIGLVYGDVAISVLIVSSRDYIYLLSFAETLSST